MYNLKCHIHKLSRGFTLLEILLAMFVFTIISMIVVGALHTVFTTQTATEANAQRLATLQMALTLMSRDFEQAINRPITTPNGGVENAFLGSEHSVTFTHAGVVNPSGKMQRSTLQRTRYHLTQGKLIRDTWPQLDLTPQSSEQKQILLQNVEALEFEYLDQKENFQTRWPPATQDQNDASLLPQAVRVRITLAHLGKISQLYVIPAQPPIPSGQPNVKPK
jgi:general secretion pathway protein J